jgi:hypothetical protein
VMVNAGRIGCGRLLSLPVVFMGTGLQNFGLVIGCCE